MYLKLDLSSTYWPADLKERTCSKANKWCCPDTLVLPRCSRIRSVLELTGLDQAWETQHIGNTNKFMLSFKDSIVRIFTQRGGGPRVVVSTAAFHARVRGSVPGLGGLKETKLFLPHPRVKVSIVGSLRDREVAYSASDRQGSNFESCVWRTVSSQSSHHPQEVLLAQFSLYVHKGGLKPDSFHLFTQRWRQDIEFK